jgi:predicted nucleic acid-binding protein
LIIADAGPLVAYLDRSDQHHAWARQTMDTFTQPLVTCDAVLAEACFLLQRGKISPSLLLQMVERGVLQPRFESKPEARVLRTLLLRYADAPMSFTDACVVRMTEILARPLVWTTDSDFTIYRRHGRTLIPVLTPFS